MHPVPIPDRYNYIAVFLTLACNLRCSFCINRFGSAEPPRARPMAGSEWVRGLDRLVTRPDLPVTLQGGEPSLHPDFIDILNGLRPDLPIDILTNLTFDVEEFARRVRPERLRRQAPYASIRVSYHPETMELAPLVERVLFLQDAGFSVGIWGVMHPLQEAAVLAAQAHCAARGIDFRTKDFLGEYDDRFYGTLRYPQACSGATRNRVLCRTTELLVGPSGGIYRCHSDLYAGRHPVGSLLDPDFSVEDEFRPCEVFGQCNPCDIKVKTNRFQEFGHTSVEVLFPGDGPQT
ncbi:MAG: radical SAM protein [Thermodesulfobacteriota bacterium]